MSIDAVLLDISGVLYQGDELLPGSLDAVRELQASGLPLRFLTNTSRKTGETVHGNLRAMGFDIDRDQVCTAPAAVKAHLRRENLRPYLLIHEQLEAEFADIEQTDPDAVVVCDAAERFDYAHLNRAFSLLMDGAPLIGVGMNRYFRSGEALALDAGPFIRALEFAADTEALIIGKPAAAFFETVLNELGVEAERALMIGDDVEADVLGAQRAGLQAALVRTGKYRDGDERRAPEAILADDLADLVGRLWRTTG